MRLRGKHRPDYTPHIDCGDNVIIINADKVKFTGNKRTDKIYYRHTGHPGGLKETTPAKILDGRFPDRVMQSGSTDASKRIASGPSATFSICVSMRVLSILMPHKTLLRWTGSLPIAKTSREHKS